MNRAGRSWWRASAALSAVGLLAMCLASTDTFGAVSAQILNNTNSAASATMLYSHSYAGSSCTSVLAGGTTDAISSIACDGSLYPSAVGASRTDTITSTGTVPAGLVTESVGVTSCGTPVIANRIASARPLVARYGTSFATTGGPMAATAGALTLDGATPGGYASGTVAQSQPTGPAVIGSATYGLGIWFKAASGAGGALFGFGDSAANATGTNDRILYLTTAGKVGFIAAPGAAAMTSTTGGFNDGNWHLAYVRIDTSRIIVGLSYTVTIYVDGTSVATGTSAAFGALSGYSGYWHVGWSPSASAAPAYFAGSLSNFVVLDGGNAPTSLAVSTSQTAFDTATSTATEHWRLNDDGVTTNTVALPVIGSTSPCSYADITWGFSTPTSCAYSPSSTTSACTLTNTMVSAVAGTAARTVATVVTGTAQTSTIALAKDSTYTGTANAYLPGLIIYAPHTITFAIGSTGWRTSFAWTSAAARFLL